MGEQSRRLHHLELLLSSLLRVLSASGGRGTGFDGDRFALEVLEGGADVFADEGGDDDGGGREGGR